MRRRHPNVVDWPPGLATCDPAEWLEPGEDIADELTRCYSCWIRWCSARERHLLLLGYSAGDAQRDSIGEFPR